MRLLCIKNMICLEFGASRPRPGDRECEFGDRECKSSVSHASTGKGAYSSTTATGHREGSYIHISQSFYVVFTPPSFSGSPDVCDYILLVVTLYY